MSFSIKMLPLPSNWSPVLIKILAQINKISSPLLKLGSFHSTSFDSFVMPPNTTDPHHQFFTPTRSITTHLQPSITKLIIGNAEPAKMVDVVCSVTIGFFITALAAIYLLTATYFRCVQAYRGKYPGKHPRGNFRCRKAVYRQFLLVVFLWLVQLIRIGLGGLQTFLGSVYCSGFSVLQKLAYFPKNLRYILPEGRASYARFRVVVRDFNGGIYRFVRAAISAVVSCGQQTLRSMSYCISHIWLLVLWMLGRGQMLPTGVSVHPDVARTKTRKNDEAEGMQWIPIELVSGAQAKVEPSDIVKPKGIAAGGFGKIHQAIDRRTGKELVVKRVPKRLLGEQGEHLLLDEIRALSKMDSDRRFPSLLGSFIDDSDYILVMPYFYRGNLRGLIERSGGCLDRFLAKTYCAELLLAIHTLHKAGIIHGDLKPENILLDGDNHLVVADFGLAKVFPKCKYKEREHRPWRKAKRQRKGHFPLLWPARNPHTVCRAVGTESYAAPEVFSEQTYSYGVDYWSMGAVYHEMVTGQLPFKMKWEKGVSYLYQPLTITLDLQIGHFQALDILGRKFLERVFSPVPEDRPSVVRMKMDNLWYDVDWKQIATGQLCVPTSRPVNRLR